MAACHLGAPDPGEQPGSGAPPPLPFVLIQGPPGTGKTHTVKVGGRAGGRAGARPGAGGTCGRIAFFFWGGGHLARQPATPTGPH